MFTLVVLSFHSQHLIENLVKNILNNIPIIIDEHYMDSIWTHWSHYYGHTKILDRVSSVCYFQILIWTDFTGLSLRKIY